MSEPFHFEIIKRLIASASNFSSYVATSPQKQEFEDLVRSLVTLYNKIAEDHGEVIPLIEFVMDYGTLIQEIISELDFETDKENLIEDVRQSQIMVYSAISSLDDLLDMYENDIENEDDLKDLKSLLTIDALRTVFLLEFQILSLKEAQFAYKLTKKEVAMISQVSKPDTNNTQTKETSNIIKPSELVAKCNEYVLGQDHVKRAVATYLASHFNSVTKMERATKSCLMITGPSGSGKSYIVSEMAKALNKPFHVIDITEFSPTGYKGNDLHEMIKYISIDSIGNPGIVFIDEIDKISTNVGYEDTHEKLQAELLKTLEQNQLCFIFAGAFEPARKKKLKSLNQGKIGFTSNPSKKSGLALTHQDLIDTGLKTELVGRIGTIVETNPITTDMLHDLITKPKGCIRDYYNQLFLDQNIRDAVSDEDVQAIITLSSELHSSLGVRGLKTVAEDYFRERLYF